MEISNQLIHWYQIHKRDLPWRHTQDPYRIWLSEILLQQTRVDQGLPYYFKFIEKFPDVQTLASAEEGEVLRAWEGLGYYSRARNLLKAAKRVVDQYGGVFPLSYIDLLELPGVGPYTSAAISSFSSGEVRAVVDGNVFRVISRLFGIEEPINRPSGQKIITQIANELISHEQPGLYNQAIMEFGALHCKPANPDCKECPFNDKCSAFNTHRVSFLPVKEKKKPVRHRYFYYFVIEEDQKLLLKQRDDTDIWANMYDFPMLESDKILSPLELACHPFVVKWFGVNNSLEELSAPIQHLLSHQKIHAQFYKVHFKESFLIKNSNWGYVMLNNLDTLAKPKLIYTFLQEYLS